MSSPSRTDDNLALKKMLASSQSFSALSLEEQVWLSTWLSDINTISYEPEQNIIHEDMPAYGCYLICQGRVSVKVKQANNELMIKIIVPGNLLGEDSLFSGGSHSYNARALDHVEAKFLSLTHIDELIQQLPNMLQQLALKLAYEVNAMQHKLLEFAFATRISRIARMLLALGQAFGSRNGSKQLEFEFTREQLGKMAGISTETAIRSLSQLVEEGVIKTQGSTLTILNIKHLRKMATPIEINPLGSVM